MRGAAPPCHRGHPGPGPGRTAPGRSPQGAKSPYETIFKRPPPEIESVLSKAGEVSSFWRFSRSDKHGGQNETGLYPVAGALKSLSLLCFWPSRQAVGRFLSVGAFLLGLVPFPAFFLIIGSSLRPPRRRGPSFCIDRKKAKNDQGCALDPDGQRRRSLKNGPFDAAQSAWAGVLRSAMIDVCLGGSMLGRAAGGGVGYGSQPLRWVISPAPSLKLA